MTPPVGSSTPLGYQRAVFSDPVDSLVSVSPPARSTVTVSIRLRFDPRGVPGDGATALGVPPAVRNDASV